MKTYITAKEVYRALPNLKWYQLENLIRSGNIEVKAFGKGIERKFPPDTINKIKKILSDRV